MAWDHESVYEALKALPENRVGKLKKSNLNPYVTLYKQEINCAILYSPDAQSYRHKPVHMNPDRPEWKRDLLEPLKRAMKLVGRSANHPEGQNFDFYEVLDWDAFATALELEQPVGVR